MSITSIGKSKEARVHHFSAEGRFVFQLIKVAARMIICATELTCYRRSIAAIQGRPLGIRDETFDLQLPTYDEARADALSIQSRSLTSHISLDGGLAFALHRFKLDPIISEIKLLFYHLPSQASAYAWPADHQSSQATIQSKLGAWRRELSGVAGTLYRDTLEIELEYRKYELKLISQYFAAMVLLYQPSQTIPQPQEQSLLICYQCAASRLNAYNDLYYAESFYQSWKSVQGIFSAGATMIYCLWTSALVRTTVTTGEAMKDLRTCTNLLSVGGEWWPSVKKGKESFVRAMDALFKALYSPAGNRHEPEQDGMPPSQRFRDEYQPPSTVPFSQNLAAQPSESRRITRNYIDSTAQHARDSSLVIPDFVPDFTNAAWTILDDPAFHHDPQNYMGPFHASAMDATNFTVEAFIAGFLNNDTAWNPF